ncbi:MAG: hypothetical protein CVT64_09710 [Actinobacteria bacterium HGW-Actinobacteria-4]|nr:MAG: hypothetical protein CVT64_09710 [Actinobacteria bacterium HGW-Actinobacteria-4]
MRVYIPGNVAELDLYVSGSWEPTRGYGVTPLLLGISPQLDPEELAEQARDAAALDSVTELKSLRRLVVVVDYPRADTKPVPNDHPAALDITGRVMLDAIACVFVDEPEAVADAKKAIKGDDAALERLEERELLWYGTTELDLIDAG